MKSFIFSLFLVTNAFAGGVYPSIIMFHEFDMKECPSKVEKAVNQFAAKNIQLIPTLHFKAKSKKNLTALCLKNENGICPNASTRLVKKFKAYLNTCITKAVNLGVEQITITPHLDDALGSGSRIWRNNIVLDPLKKLPTVSYREFVLNPIFEIIQTLPRKMKISFFLQGEMGASVFKFPKSYQKIFTDFRKHLTRNVSVGVSFNHNYVGGTYVYQTSEVKNVEELLRNMDLIGFSNYRKVSRFVNKNSFNKHIELFRTEFSNLGLNINRSKKIIFNEVGIGGGKFTDDGKTPATSARAVALAPYAGIRGTYLASQDPWQNEKLAAFRKKYYKSLLEYSKTYNVDAYLWNADSWDVLGFYRNHEKYADKEIVKLFKNQ